MFNKNKLYHNKEYIEREFLRPAAESFCNSLVALYGMSHCVVTDVELTDEGEGKVTVIFFELDEGWFINREIILKINNDNNNFL